MRRILTFVAFLLLATPLYAACGDPGDPCKQCTAVTKPNGVTSSSVSFGSTPTIGNKIKIAVAGFHTIDITSHASVITDNQSGNSYALDSGASILSTDVHNRNDILSGYVVGSSGTYTMSLAMGGATFSAAWIACEIQHVAPSSSYDRHGTQETLSNTTLTVTATGANAQAYELVMALNFNNGGGGGASTPSGYTQIFLDTTLIGAEFAYKIVSAGETSAATWTYSSGNALGVLTTDKLVNSLVQRRTANSPRTGTRTIQ